MRLRTMGELQVFEKTITSAANAGDITIATVTEGPVIIIGAIIYANAAQPVQMTSAGLYAGVAQAMVLIAAADASQANLSAVDDQVNGDVTPGQYYPVGKTVTQSLIGTGANPLNLRDIILYMAADTTGGYLV